MRARRALLVALAAATALPAAAYLPPATAILKRAGQRRLESAPAAFEVKGSLALFGAAARAATAAGLPPTGEAGIPAVLVVKAPARCRLELAAEGVPGGERPAVSTRVGRVHGRRGLDAVPAARALVEGVGALLAERGADGRALAQALAGRNVALQDVALGRLGTHVAWVLGGRPRDARPQAWIDKATFQPIRLVAPLAGEVRDLRLLDFGSPAGGEAFPRAVEVWEGGQLAARLVTEKVTPNPRVPDTAF